VAAIALLIGATGAQAATSRLVSRSDVAPDTQRLTYRYGPLEAVAGQNLILVGPVTIEKPPAGSFVTRVQATVVDDAGGTPPVEQVHMHHAVMLNLTKPDAGAPSVPERFYGFAEEKTVGQLPPGYGYPVAASDLWAINYMLHNETPVNRSIWIEYTVDVVPATSATGRGLVPVHPEQPQRRFAKLRQFHAVGQRDGRAGRFEQRHVVVRAVIARLNRGRHLNDDRRGAKRVGELHVVHVHQREHLARGLDVDLELAGTTAAHFSLASGRGAGEAGWLINSITDRARGLVGRGYGACRSWAGGRGLAYEQGVLVEVQALKLPDSLRAGRHKQHRPHAEDLQKLVGRGAQRGKRQQADDHHNRRQPGQQRPAPPRPETSRDAHFNTPC
jgi:hypothetical protein